eukprot:TRINITY_DN561_c0_g3_i1.p1 TRINITY_DN561_c0_g3~~TRINITY_DN561_c0_g3_i1.p1  ORF type:complete len:323 (-),score=165.46 TRINITY_DN561_c0_g3_i1:45-1013(-)
MAYLHKMSRPDETGDDLATLSGAPSSVSCSSPRSMAPFAALAAVLTRVARLGSRRKGRRNKRHSLPLSFQRDSLDDEDDDYDGSLDAFGWAAVSPATRAKFDMLGSSDDEDDDDDVDVGTDVLAGAGDDALVARDVTNMHGDDGDDGGDDTSYDESVVGAGNADTGAHPTAAATKATAATGGAALTAAAKATAASGASNGNVSSSPTLLGKPPSLAGAGSSERLVGVWGGAGGDGDGSSELRTVSLSRSHPTIVPPQRLFVNARSMSASRRHRPHRSDREEAGGPTESNDDDVESASLDAAVAVRKHASSKRSGRRKHPIPD